MINLEKYAGLSFEKTLQAIDAFNTPDNRQYLCLLAEKMLQVIKAQRKIMVCGNGGSACQAMHFAEELTGRYQKDRRALPALSLTDSAHISCVANDYGYEWVFSRAVEAYAQQGDCLLLLSTSGESPNLLNAAKAAARLGVICIGLLGKGGGSLKNYCDYPLVVAGNSSDCIQNLHMMIIHVLIELIERDLFPENYL